MTSANSLRTVGLNLSGPAGLCRFSWFSLFLSPSSVMFSGGIWGVVLCDPSDMRNPADLVFRALDDNGHQEKN